MLVEEIQVWERPGEPFGGGEAGIAVLRRDLGHRDGPRGQFVGVGQDIGGDGGEAAAGEDAKVEVVALGAARFLDLAEANLDRHRHATHADRIGGVGAGALRRLDKTGGAVEEILLVELGGHGGNPVSLVYAGFG